jgi:hypothetical protein
MVPPDQWDQWDQLVHLERGEQEVAGDQKEVAECLDHLDHLEVLADKDFLVGQATLGSQANPEGREESTAKMT